jgi:Protein of unknown function (DUF1587)
VLGSATLMVCSTQAKVSAVAHSATVTALVRMPVLRRLIRIEYANSLRDLLDSEFPFLAESPADGQVARFGNNCDALSLSPVLLDSYLKVARKIGDLVRAGGSISAVTEQFPAIGSQS